MTRLEVDMDFPEQGNLNCDVRVVQECTTPRKQRAEELLIAHSVRTCVIELLKSMAEMSERQAERT